jgi:hypothetical protein
MIGEAVAVSAGYFDSCAMDDLGKFYCWGDSTSGQTGVGSISSARELKDFGVAVPIASGYAHNCAGFWCIGENGSGQLGDGSTVSKSAMTAVDLTNVPVGLRTVKSVAAGFDFTCWVSGDEVGGLEDAVWCAGSLVDSDVPVAVDVDGVEREEIYINLTMNTYDMSLGGPPNVALADDLTTTVVTNNLVGYELMIKSAQPTLECAISALGIEALPTAAGVMIDNHWGWGVNSSAPPAGWTGWHGVSVSDEPIATSGVATSVMGDSAQIWFGTKFNMGLPACRYSGEATLSAVAAV